MRLAITLTLCLILSGCASLQKGLENRVACTPDGEPWVLSKWFLFAIGSQIDKADAAVCARK
jgi:starvation-inducible outer membrane lipoprotein